MFANDSPGCQLFRAKRPLGTCAPRETPAFDVAAARSFFQSWYSRCGDLSAAFCCRVSPTRNERCPSPVRGEVQCAPVATLRFERSRSAINSREIVSSCCSAGLLAGDPAGLPAIRLVCFQTAAISELWKARRCKCQPTALISDCSGGGRWRRGGREPTVSTPRALPKRRLAVCLGSWTAGLPDAGVLTDSRIPR